VLVTYRPTGGDEQSWDYDRDQVKASRAEAIERRFGASWEQFNLGVMQGSMKARRVLLWYLSTLTHPNLRYEDTPDFAAGELVCQFSSTELLGLRERAMKANLSDDDREAMLVGLDLELTEAMAREGLDEADGSGKAPSPSVEPATP
jgi:hypothetical protein